MIGSQETAKDILQIVFLKLWKNIKNYDESKGRLYTWMLNVVRNSAIDNLRSATHYRDKKTCDIYNNVHVNNISFSTTIKTDHLGVKK